MIYNHIAQTIVFIKEQLPYVDFHNFFRCIPLCSDMCNLQDPNLHILLWFRVHRGLGYMGDLKIYTRTPTSIHVSARENDIDNRLK